MTEQAKKSRKRSGRILLWTVLTIFLGTVLLPLTGYLYVEVVSAQSAAEDNPRANYWRAVRGGGEGYVSSSGPYTTNVLIQNGGQNWRQLRNGPIASYGPWLLAIMVGAIFLFQIFRGTVRLEAPPSGKVVMRWSMGERVLHWYTAVLFIILSITGLSLLFGRAVLIPVLGPAGFSAWAGFAVTAHNYLGPFFVIGIVIEILSWIRHNIPNATDMKWFAQGGGLVGKGHPSAGRMNGGEKVWFWIICTVGVAVCVTGLILDFPNFGWTRETMQLSSLIHAITAIIWVTVAIGHIWIGTLGTAGSLQGMTTGCVSSEWAKQHHDLWYEQVKDKEFTPADGPERGAQEQPG